MAKKFKESANKRFKRYEKAVGRMTVWSGLLDEAYRYSLPDRNDFFEKTIGEDRMKDIFDTTAITGVQDFATNIQSILTPPFKRWATLSAGDLIGDNEEIDDELRKQIDEALQERTEVLFKHLNASNFALVSNEALQDVSISTAVMLINEGPQEDPLQFISVPLSQIAVTEGVDGRLENFWRKWSIPVNQIQEKWPGAKMTQRLAEALSGDPEKLIDVIEGCIKYADNDEDSKYFYYVQLIDGQEDIFEEFRDYTPFIGFRFNVATNEIMGRGPILTLLPDIKVLNKMKEFDLKGAALRAFPTYTIMNNSVINSNTIEIEPGALIDVEPVVGGGNPIQPVEVGGDPQFTQLQIGQLQQKIKDTMFSDPLGEPSQTTNQSATQTEIRQQNWIRRSGSAFGRLTAEWLTPVLDKCIRILRKKNLLQDLEIAGAEIELKVQDKTIQINFESPLLAIQDNEDFQKLVAHTQFVGETFGPTGIAAAYKLERIPQWTAEKLGVNLDLVNDETDVRNQFQQIQQAQQQAQQQPEAQPEQLGEIQPPSPLPEGG